MSEMLEGAWVHNLFFYAVMMRNQLFKPAICLFWVASVCVVPFSFAMEGGLNTPSAALEIVTLQLKWKHQFQFAGYYAALEKGLYRQAGLNVTILEAHDGTTSIESVLSGQADFGIAMADLIPARAHGRPVVAMAAIYQHSPLVILAPQSSGIDNVHDLKGKRVAMEGHAAELLAYFESEGVSARDMILFPHEYNISDLIAGQVDAMSAYSTDEPFQLLQKGIAYRTFSARAGGIDFYGDTLFTSERQVREHPERVAAFLAASLQGWRYALNHTEEIIALILAKYTQRHSKEHLRFEARMTKRLVMADVVELGYMNPGRWNHIANTFKTLNSIPTDFSLEGFIYDRNPAPDLIWLYLSLAGAMAIALLAFVISGRFYNLNRSLHKEFERRRQTESALKSSERKLSTLLSNLPGMAYRCHNDDDFTMLFVSQGCRELTGYDASDMLNSATVSYSQLIHPQDREGVVNDVNAAVAACSPFKLTYRIVDRSGNVRWVWEQGRGIFAPNGELKFLEGLISDISKQKEIEKEREALITKLQAAQGEVKTLSGLLPLCSHCKKIRDDNGYWNQIEAYITSHADVDFSHSICPECARKYYPDFKIYP